MSSNGSLDFLNMIKNSQGSSGRQRPGNPMRDYRQLNDTEKQAFEYSVTERQIVGRQLTDKPGTERYETERKTAELQTSERQTTDRQVYERAKRPAKAEPAPAATGDVIAVIDTETNWHDEVMSVGVVLGDAKTYKCIDRRYYVFEPECMVGGMFSNVMYIKGTEPITGSRDEALADLGQYLMDNGVEKIMAYNARFDLTHLPELAGFEWYDIMRIAAYKQFNRSIPDSLPCCKTGRLKSNYGVEAIMRMLAGDVTYREVHNALMDAVDELKIVELLGQELDIYDCARVE